MGLADFGREMRYRQSATKPWGRLTLAGFSERWWQILDLAVFGHLVDLVNAKGYYNASLLSRLGLL